MELVYDAANPDPLYPRFIRMDSEAAYTSEDFLELVAQRGYKIEFTAPRDKHAGSIAERMVRLVTSKTNSAMLDNGEELNNSESSCWALLGNVGSVSE